MSAEHTPGPWQSIGSTGSVWCGEVFVASVYGDDPDCKPDARMKANGRLIAAAPTMYAFIEKKAEDGDEEAQKLIGAIHATL